MAYTHSIDWFIKSGIKCEVFGFDSVVNEEQTEQCFFFVRSTLLIFFGSTEI